MNVLPDAAGLATYRDPDAGLLAYWPSGKLIYQRWVRPFPCHTPCCVRVSGAAFVISG
jgi:hypothetical protein